MNNLLKILKALFSKKEENKNFPLGAFPNEIDNRDIPYATVAGIVPEKFPIKMTAKNFHETQRLMQDGLGTCVSYSFEFYKRALDGIVHSRRFIYALTRQVIGWTEAFGQGLPQRDAAKIVTVAGMPKDLGIDDNSLSHKVYAGLSITKAMRDEANLHKFSGFSFPVINELGIKHALSNGLMVAVTVAVDWNVLEPDGTMHAPNQTYGFHEIVLGESDDLSARFHCANWWPTGDLYIPYGEVEKIIVDAIVFSDLPGDLVARAKTMQYIFTNNLSVGDKNAAVVQLEKRMAAYGLYKGILDGKFGPGLLQAVKMYQKIKGLEIDGKVGPGTRQALNADSGNIGVVKSKLDLWIEAATIMEGAKPYRNNPGNLRFVGQMYAVNDAGFCKFDTYAHGYAALRNLLIAAASGSLRYYNPNGDLYAFYNVYAPGSDGNDPKRYAEFVAKRIGVDPQVQIKTLIA